MRRATWVILVLYVFALALSHVFTRTPSAGAPVRSVDVSDTRGNAARMAYSEWAAPTPDAPVIVLLHGSPGASGNFATLGPLLAARGYRVIAPDLLGFGRSTLRVADHSIRAQADATSQLLERLGIARAHVVGWSNGGGTALWMAHTQPSVVQSLTLMGSIGEQRFEGSGSYALEHTKYRVGFALIGAVPELLPHFGALGTYDARTGWLRNFADTDQRELSGIIAALGQGDMARRTLIVHGAGDVLVRLASAEAMHAAMPGSALVVLDANHFLPFQQAEVTTDVIDRFARGKVAPSATREALARERTGLLALVDAMRDLIRATPWWVHVLVLALLTGRKPAWGVLFASLAVASDFGPGMDIFVALLGLLGGMGMWTVRTVRGAAPDHARDAGWRNRLARAPLLEGWNAGLLHSWRPHAAAGLWRTRPVSVGAAGAYVVSVIVWCVVSLVAGTIGFGIIEHGFAVRLHGWSAVVASLTLLLGMLKIGWSAPRLASLLSLRGWRFARIALERLVHFEYWPTWAVYAPIMPGLLWLAWRHGHLLAFTAANPAIRNGGGFVGESKAEILRDLGASNLIARAVRVEPCNDITERLPRARELMDAAGIALPCIGKPDEGQRGHAVKLLRRDDDVREYLQAMPGAVVLQAFAPGPRECGILWCRKSGEADGFIFSVTAKEFPVLTGDGVHTLEELIERHPRFRRQHRTFLTRFAADATRVVPRSESLALGVAGNHCQGTKFIDGAHLITPALTEVINGVCRNYAGERFAGDARGGLDWVRFDVRYASDEGLRAGRDLQIVEMNGTSAESTNLYDPERSLWWSYGVLWRQWQRLFALGRERMDAGAGPLSARQLLALARAHARQQTGSSVAD